jgi:hypothetical protein
MRSKPTQAERDRALVAIASLIDFCEKHYQPAIEPLSMLAEVVDQYDDYSGEIDTYEKKRAEQDAARIADCVISLAAKR